MHSPWGLNYHIAKETGYTLHYLMWKISWVNLMLMIDDAPGYEWVETDDTVIVDDYDEIMKDFNF